MLLSGTGNGARCRFIGVYVCQCCRYADTALQRASELRPHGSSGVSGSAARSLQADQAQGQLPAVREQACNAHSSVKVGHSISCPARITQSRDAQHVDLQCMLLRQLGILQTVEGSPRRCSSLWMASQLRPGSRLAVRMACSAVMRLPLIHENRSAARSCQDNQDHHSMYTLLHGQVNLLKTDVEPSGI